MVYILIFILLLLILSTYLSKRIMTKEFKNWTKLNHSKSVIVVGSGPGKFDVDFGELDDCINLSVWPEDFRYDYRMLKNKSNLLQKGTVVFHFICPLSFAKNKYLKENNYNKKYVHVLPSKDVDLPYSIYVLEKYFYLFIHPRRILSFLKKNIGCNNFSFQEQKEKLITSWLRENPGLENLKDAEKGKQFEEAFKENTHYLKMIVTLCQTHEWRYIPIIAPMSNDLKSSISDTFLNEFLYKNIVFLQSDFEVLDFLKKKEFSDNRLYTDFPLQNGLFLNETGRTKMTKELLAYIGRHD